jgi:hypothetical protein
MVEITVLIEIGIHDDFTKQMQCIKLYFSEPVLYFSGPVEGGISFINTDKYFRESFSEIRPKIITKREPTLPIDFFVHGSQNLLQNHQQQCAMQCILPIILFQPNRAKNESEN